MHPLSLRRRSLGLGAVLALVASSLGCATERNEPPAPAPAGDTGLVTDAYPSFMPLCAASSTGPSAGEVQGGFNVQPGLTRIGALVSQGAVSVVQLAAARTVSVADGSAAYSWRGDDRLRFDRDGYVAMLQPAVAGDDTPTWSVADNEAARGFVDSAAAGPSEIVHQVGARMERFSASAAEWSAMPPPGASLPMPPTSYPDDTRVVLSIHAKALFEVSTRIKFMSDDRCHARALAAIVYDTPAFEGLEAPRLSELVKSPRRAVIERYFREHRDWRSSGVFLTTESSSNDAARIRLICDPRNLSTCESMLDLQTTVLTEFRDRVLAARTASDATYGFTPGPWPFIDDWVRTTSLGEVRAAAR